MDASVGIALQPGRGEPLYRQLFDQIVARIRSGTFPPGYRLPPTRVLAGQLATHRNTVVHAFEELESAGFVQSTVGRGTFVANPPPEAAPGEAAAGGELPWSSLTSLALGAEPLHRSERLTRMPTSPNAINLSRMQPSPDLLPVELFRRCTDHALKAYGARALEYAPREGVARLRGLVASDLRRQGVPASAEDLFITTGSQQAIDLVARALVNPGDSVLVDEATYHGALNVFSVLSSRLIGVPSDDEGPSLSHLDQHVRAGPKVLYLMPNCHNPTGATISARRREALVAWSHRASVPIIEDDYASDLQLDGKAPPVAMRALDGDVIYLGTYSKKLIPGLRVGYLLVPRALRQAIASLKYAMDLGTSSLVQYALAEYLDRGYLPAHLGKVVAEYRRRRDALEGSLRRALPRNVQWRTPHAGLQMWLPAPPEIDVDALFRESQAQGVVISPGTLNGVIATGVRGVRLTFCSEPSARLAEAGRRLGRAWAALAKRSRPRADRSGARLETV
jgi:DNA-binding transcriptional MocR family regulator